MATTLGVAQARGALISDLICARPRRAGAKGSATWEKLLQGVDTHSPSLRGFLGRASHLFLLHLSTFGCESVRVLHRNNPFL